MNWAASRCARHHVLRRVVKRVDKFGAAEVGFEFADATLAGCLWKLRVLLDMRLFCPLQNLSVTPNAKCRAITPTTFSFK